MGLTVDWQLLTIQQQSGIKVFTLGFVVGNGGCTPTWGGVGATVANDTLLEVHRSDEFIDAQRRMLRAASDRHLQERKVAEAWCEAGHIPTRSEIDELQRHVVELRREVRLLRRALPDAAKPASAASARKAPARRPSATKRARS